MLEQELELWALDAEINDRGIPIDVPMVRSAISIRESEKRRMMDRLRIITGLENPNSRNQILEWFNSHGLELDNLQAETIEAKIKELEQ